MRGLTWVGTLIDRVGIWIEEFVYYFDWFCFLFFSWAGDMYSKLVDFYDSYNEKAQGQIDELETITETLNEHYTFSDSKTISTEDLFKGMLTELRLIRIHLEILSDETIKENETGERL